MKKIFMMCLIFLIFSPQFAASEEIFKFDRLWPTLQQPWYFDKPNDIATDRIGFVYVADTRNHRIQKFTEDGQLVSKWGSPGWGDKQFYEPAGIAADAKGFIYVADASYIRKFTTDGQFVSKWKSPDGDFSPSALAVDDNGFVYVADSYKHHIQKFSDEGKFVSEWGGNGSEDGEFASPSGIAADTDGFIYVADTQNSRIQKFTSDGEFVSEWESSDAENLPSGITADNNGFVYVSERNASPDPEKRISRVRKFTTDGQLISQWGSEGSGDGQLDDPSGLAVDKSFVYVADWNNDRIHKFTSDGGFVSNWQSLGAREGEFRHPEGMARDSEGNIYVADKGNHRIQKFTSDGDFVLKWGSKGSNDGQFDFPFGIAAQDDSVYVADMFNNRIQKFDLEGRFVAKWGSPGDEDGQFADPAGIAVDNGFVYVADWENHRIQKFDAEGRFIAKWGCQGNGDGQFDSPLAIAVANGFVYVTDRDNHRIQKFDPEGRFIAKWGSQGDEDGQFVNPSGIAADSKGFIYVADTETHRIQKFTPEGQFAAKFGEFGPDPGSLNSPSFLCVSPGDRIYVSDSMNNRIQVFRKSDLTEGVTKAVIVAGGGPYKGNKLWDATQMCANFAYRTLTYQGLTKETIYYLTSDTELDLDSNGVSDDVDGDATSTNLQYAITEWAVHEPVADSLVISIVNHGGQNTFRMSDTEILSASELDSWLDSLQEAIHCKVIVIYDACKSGSFLASLTPPSDKLRERIVISSASHDEPAYFVTQGSVSFSSYFWTHIFNGLDIKNAFNLAKNAMESPTEFQHSLLDANGNGKGNEPEDEIMIQNICIGNGTLISGEAPVIGSVSPDQTISGTSDSLLYAADVTDDDGVARVWTMIRPPDYIRGSSDNPVRELPSADLMPAEDKQYKNTYRDFNAEGTYQIAVYARDRAGNTSVPKLTTVSVENPSRRRAIIVAGGFRSDDLWPAVEKIAGLAYEALRFQGYSDDDIYFMSPVTFSEGVDGLATLGNLGDDALGTWAEEDTRDLVLYMVGNGDTGTFEISDTETLSAPVLDNWLDNLQDHIPGRVTLIYDACRSGSFLGPLTPPPGKERIFISSAGPDQPACFLSDGDISFSRFFWSHVLNGADVFKGFFEAMNVMLAFKNQLPLLNTDGNGIANEDADGVLARDYTLGAGIMLAGDDPLIGSVSPEQTIYGQASALIWAKDVTTTGEIENVLAIITPPGSENMPEIPLTELPSSDLAYNPESGRYEGTYKGFSNYGKYTIAIYAKDTEGNISLPEASSVYRYADPISGDINGDGNIDLRDAIVALKSVAGTEELADLIRSDYARSGTDVNEDNKLGLEEVIHILQQQMR